MYNKYYKAENKNKKWGDPPRSRFLFSISPLRVSSVIMFPSAAAHIDW